MISHKRKRKQSSEELKTETSEMCAFCSLMEQSYFWSCENSLDIPWSDLTLGPFEGFNQQKVAECFPQMNILTFARVISTLLHTLNRRTAFINEDLFLYIKDSLCVIYFRILQRIVNLTCGIVTYLTTMRMYVHNKPCEFSFIFACKQNLISTLLTSLRNSLSLSLSLSMAQQPLESFGHPLMKISLSLFSTRGRVMGDKSIGS